MSFLEQLQKKKTILKPTTTQITQADGRRFLQSTEDSSLTEITRNTYGFVVDTKPDNIPAKITENVYLGSQDCCDIQTLTDHKISYVLSVGIEAPLKYPNITYKFVQCLDLPDSNIEDSLRECIPFIETAVKQCCNVLVHCNAGVSRSASVVIGYLILVHNYSYLEAYDAVKTARCSVCPNQGFQKQLKCLHSSKCMQVFFDK